MDDPISIALGLAEFVPVITRWIGGEKPAEVAQRVVDVAKTVTGKTGQAALDAIKDSAAAQNAFRRALAADADDLEKAYLADRSDARTRNAALEYAGRRNLRGDVLAYTAIGGLISLIWMLLVHPIAEGATRDILLILSGALVAIAKDVYGFEFGSSRGSEVKTEQLGQLMGGHRRGSGEAP